MAKRRFYQPKKIPRDSSGGVYDDAGNANTNLDPAKASDVYSKSGDFLDKADSELANSERLRSDIAQKSGEYGELGKSESPESINQAESNPDDETTTDESSKTEQKSLDEREKSDDFSYRHEGKGMTSKVLSRFSGLSTAQKAALGGLGVTGLMSVLIFAFMTFLPLKINHIVKNVQSKFFATSEAAVEKRTEHLFTVYMRKYVLPGFTNCPGVSSTRTITKDCTVAVDGETPAHRMFRGWRDARLENKLADNYGIEFEKRGGAGYVLKARGLPEIEVGDDDLLATNRTEFRNRYKAAFSKAFESETRWKRTMYRVKVARLLERKYGIRRCLFFCKTTDKAQDWKENKRDAMRQKIIQRVVVPHTEHVGVALLCLMDSNCVRAQESPTADGEDNGRRTQMEKEITGLLERAGKEAVTSSVDDIAKLVKELEDGGGFSRYIIKRVVSKVLGKEAADIASGAIPVVGWIDRALDIINVVANAGPAMKRAVYFVNSTAMISFFTMYIAHADELKNGNLDKADFDAELLGSAVSTLGDSKQYLNDSEEGVAAKANQPAEISPLYQSYFGQSYTKTSLQDFLSPKTYAQATGVAPQKPVAKCDDGSTVSEEKLICDEESLVTDNLITQTSSLFNSGPLSILKSVANKYAEVKDSILGPIIDFFGDVISKVPGASELFGVIGDWVSSFFEVIADKIIPSPIADKNSGVRSVNMVMGGGDASASEFGQYGTGGQRLADSTVAQIRAEQENKARQDFSEQSFFARMFDDESPYSLVSTMAMEMPGSTERLSQTSLASMIGNPVEKMANVFSSVFAKRKFASAAPAADPFGIPQFGWGNTDPAFTADPDIYTDAYCTQVNKDWQAGEGEFAGTLIIDEATGIDVHTKPNPCLLEEAAAGAGGGFYTDTVFPAKDLRDAGSDGGSGGAAGGPVGGGTLDPNLPQGSAEELQQKINAECNVTYDPGITPNGLKQTTLSVIYALCKKYSFQISSALRPGGGTSAHATGHAFDLNGVNGNHHPDNYSYWAPIFQEFINDAAGIVPSGSWLGVPNDRYLTGAMAIGGPRGVTGDIDLGTGAHFHIGVPRDSP